MKKLLGIALSVLIFAACQKEEIPVDKTTFDDVVQNNKATGKKARPLSGDLNNAPVPGYPAASCSGVFTVSGQNFLYGTVSHLGRLKSGSLGTVQACNFFIDGTITYKEVWVAANGDKVYSDSYIILADNGDGSGTWTGEGTITGGTGRFSGASGSWTFANARYFADGTAAWEINGEIVY
jgi:hypothetical protein